MSVINVVNFNAGFRMFIESGPFLNALTKGMASNIECVVRKIRKVGKLNIFFHRGLAANQIVLAAPGAAGDQIGAANQIELHPAEYSLDESDPEIGAVRKTLLEVAAAKVFVKKQMLYIDKYLEEVAAEEKETLCLALIGAADVPLHIRESWKMYEF